ncbi:single-stranded DNA-binding protein [Sulfitobacter dubius]|uniref:single-stranded DNA-binding protein n=1 Tax=Sulfitobacter dubius TaxID=218673 RepID=UPI0022B07ADE|nr:single-stranded DNA-binding protein [Sulfitobacter dubius]MCZ4366654.1 single-stranded DNA-binding protein [Sulfitobacter dubius]
MATVTFSGYVSKEPELRKAGLHDVLSFRVPVETGYGDRKITTWYAVSHFRGAAKLAEIIRKGTYVTVSGELSAREYEHNGARRTSLEVNSDRVNLGPKTGTAGGNTTPPPAAAAETDDEIPF